MFFYIYLFFGFLRGLGFSFLILCFLILVLTFLLTKKRDLPGKGNVFSKKTSTNMTYTAYNSSRLETH